MSEHRLADAAAGSTAPARSASPSTAGATRALPATRWHPRCSPTACAWSGAASSITGRAASSAPAPRSRTRWCNSATARAPSPTCAPPRSRFLTALPRAARTAGPRSASIWARSSNLLSPLFPAGFYYKTFMWPPSFWHLYERLIRRAAGMGEAPREPDPDRYEHVHAHCDVLVVGSGPAGLAAALAAGRSGARVLLADEQAEPGGSLLERACRSCGACLARGEPRRASSPAGDQVAAPHHRVRLLRPQLSRAARAGERPSRPQGAAAPAAPADVEGARASGRARYRRARAAAGLRRQRLSRRDAGGRGPQLSQPLCGPARTSRGADQQR